jgi:1-acyl-sn-glycerol-3-phosphate acyltransferase
MSDSEPHRPNPDDADSGATVEFAAQAGTSDSGALPVRVGDLREQLPGLEPERRVSDWGRSERLEGAVDRLVYDFLYHYWFRVEVEGIENVPERGGALLVANHSGALPSDGAMVVKGVRETHPLTRQVHLATDAALAGIPGLGMMITKLGGISGHPANLHRLLYDEDALVLTFPEGRAGARKSIRHRYLLRPFADTSFVHTAANAGTPIVPVAVLGAEEASPVFAPLGRLRRLMRVPGLALGPALPLPAKFRIRFLEPITPGESEPDGGGETDHRALVADIRALIQENLFEMVGARQSVWFG